MSGRGSQGAWPQDELIGGKPPVLRNFDFDLMSYQFSQLCTGVCEVRIWVREAKETSLLEAIARKQLVKTCRLEEI
jgi:hypothetical protein